MKSWLNKTLSLAELETRVLGTSAFDKATIEQRGVTPLLKGEGLGVRFRVNVLLWVILLMPLLFSVSCSEEKRSDETLLWEYYKGFTYPPQLFDSLSRLAQEPITKQFFSGLKCFEKY